MEHIHYFTVEVEDDLIGKAMSIPPSYWCYERRKVSRGLALPGTGRGKGTGM